ncbi:MAG: penicillin-binding protein 2 [Desulfobulbaceae bacterium]|uniref:Penicillin-binding protein 2 n=1 Tax=Candidatus Desulfobia pelagia TaxID=2841692 RepID=A0A8J6TGG4_9BACT|nr:penicillin-binding protein 2 [Candidatus Desulfobia pelagia]
MRQDTQKLRTVNEEELTALKKRIDLAIGVIILFLAILIARLWNLQILKGPEFATLSENNSVRIRDISAPRGNILDRHGRLIITNRPYFNVVWFKEDAPVPDEVIQKLSPILKEDISTLLTRIREAAGQPRYIPILLKEDIPWSALIYIENHRLDLPGVRVEVVPSRNYKYSNLASHLVGYLGQISKKELQSSQYQQYKGGDQVGKMGVEKRFEETLRGEKGRRYLEVDVHGFEQQQLKHIDPLPGNDIQLTIDVDLQKTAEESMAGKAGTVIAMEVNSGRLLAIASTPELKIDKFIGGIPIDIWQEHLDDPLHPLINKTIQGVYPPGSTYKIVTALAGLSEKVITPKTIFYCSGSYSLHGRRYGCWKSGGHGAIDLKRALAESCDVYFYITGQKLGIDTLAKYAKSMGLGEKTGIPLDHEKSGLVPTSDWKKRQKKESWQEGETLSAAIGQGFNLTTPLQICCLTAATVNGGILYQPQFIESITDPEGSILQQFTPVKTGEVLGSHAYLDIIKKGLIEVVNDKHGTGIKAKLDNIVIGGKTGTAQVVRLSKFKNVPDDEIPYRYRDHAWFTSFAPADNPEIAVTVLVEHGGHGGSVAGPIAKQVLEKYFELKNKQPEQ